MHFNNITLQYLVLQLIIQTVIPCPQQGTTVTASNDERKSLTLPSQSHRFTRLSENARFSQIVLLTVFPLSLAHSSNLQLIFRVRSYIHTELCAYFGRGPYVFLEGWWWFASPFSPSQPASSWNKPVTKNSQPASQPACLLPAMNLLPCHRGRFVPWRSILRGFPRRGPVNVVATASCTKLCWE